MSNNRKKRKLIEEKEKEIEKKEEKEIELINEKEIELDNKNEKYEILNNNNNDVEIIDLIDLDSDIFIATKISKKQSNITSKSNDDSIDLDNYIYCNICQSYNLPNDIYSTSCNHTYCILCIIKYTELQFMSLEELNCKVCNNILNLNDLCNILKENILCQKLLEIKSNLIQDLKCREDLIYNELIDISVLDTFFATTESTINTINHFTSLAFIIKLIKDGSLGDSRDVTYVASKIANPHSSNGSHNAIDPGNSEYSDNEPGYSASSESSSFQGIPGFGQFMNLIFSGVQPHSVSKKFNSNSAKGHGYGGSAEEVASTALAIKNSANQVMSKRKYLSKLFHAIRNLLEPIFNYKTSVDFNIDLQIFSLLYLDENFMFELSEYFRLSISDIAAEIEPFTEVLNLVQLLFNHHNFIYLLRPDGSSREIAYSRTLPSIGSLLLATQKSLDFYSKNVKLKESNSQVDNLLISLSILIQTYNLNADIFLKNNSKLIKAKSPSDVLKSISNIKTTSTLLNDNEFTKVEELNSLDIFNRNKASDILKAAQFGTTKLIGPDVVLKHKYESMVSNNKKGAPQNKIWKEMASLMNNMPWGIYLRLDEDRYDIIRFMITGPLDTPYSLGLFLFDAYLPPNYPQVPPMVNLVTTGNGACRFNPNLYKCGKVCLSLLGTWGGPGWQPNVSTFFQVLISIQAMILNEHPLLNEPGYESQLNTPMEIAYNLNLHDSTLLYACNWQIEKPPASFEQCVNAHFYYYKYYFIHYQLPKWKSEIIESAPKSKYKKKPDPLVGHDYIDSAKANQTTDEVHFKLLKQLQNLELNLST